MARLCGSEDEHPPRQNTPLNLPDAVKMFGVFMKIHGIQTGRVQIKRAQIEGRGHGLWRQAQPLLSSEWTDWSPTYA